VTPRWQIDRSGLNHDWLKNVFLNRLDGFLARLNSPGSDPKRLRRFIDQDLPGWPKKAREMKVLVQRFEAEMSPRVLFEESPLLAPLKKSHPWTVDLIHDLWKVRHPVSNWVEDAIAALDAANSAYEDLTKMLKPPVDADENTFRANLEAFAHFREKCAELSQAISAFPTGILVV